MHGLAWQHVALATGEDFPDALAGGPMIGYRSGPLLLTPTYSLHSAPRQKLIDHSGGPIDQVYYLGGPNALSPAVRSEVEAVTH